MKALVHAILHSNDALFTPASCLRTSVEFAIYRVRGGSDACTTGGPPTKPEPACLELLRQVWRDGLKEVSRVRLTISNYCHRRRDADLEFWPRILLNRTVRDRDGKRVRPH